MNSETRKRINLIESINQVVSAEPRAIRIAKIAMKQIQEMYDRNNSKKQNIQNRW